MKIRTLIVDDQVIGREHLRRLLEQEPDVEIIGLCAGGREAVETIRKLSPDVVILDVQMPELNGFDVLAQLAPEQMPAVIFVTAHDVHALEAFRVHALDYIVKPCDPDRLHKALRRVRRRVEDQRPGDVNQRLLALLDELQVAPKRMDRMAVKTNGRVLFLKTDDITWVEAADNYVKLHVGGEAHLMRETLTAMEKRLSSQKFLRISRSAIVNMERIKELQPMFHGEYSVILRDGTRLTLSRNYRDKLHQLGVS